MIRLLVVDDAPFIREIVKHSMKGSSIEVVAEAEDGEEAFMMARLHRPDVILMDIVLPKKNGIDTATEILNLYPEMKIIAFSTNDHESVVIRALDAGCCSFIVKPFNAKELIAAIEQAVQAPELDPRSGHV